MESLGTAEISALGESPALKDVMMWAKLGDEQVRSLCELFELEYDTLNSEPPPLFAMVDSALFGLLLADWRLPAVAEGAEER
eukprot:2589563-Amphidinium_carterae.1